MVVDMVVRLIKLLQTMFERDREFLPVRNLNERDRCPAKKAHVANEMTKRRALHGLRGPGIRAACLRKFWMASLAGIF